jgi:type II secretory pathway component PulK
MNKWAGGPGDPNSSVASLPLDRYELGDGTISVKIVDWDRKLNINVADEVILRQALILIGVDASTQGTIVDSILDWRDPDSTPHRSGAESDYYLRLSLPYFAKDGPLDTLSELLRVNGVTPAMYWGASASGPEPNFAVGLVDLFTPVSGRLINLNTASAAVLQLIPEIDENLASAIISGPGGRAGPDGVDGTADDMPFRSPQELARVPGLPPMMAQQLARFFTVRSLVFEVTVEAQFGEDQRTYVGLLRRSSPQNIQPLYFYER